MKDQNKTKFQLISELEKSYKYISVLEQYRSEQKQVENALRDSEEKLRHAVELSPNGIVTINLKGMVLSVNRAFTE